MAIEDVSETYAVDSGFFASIIELDAVTAGDDLTVHYTIKQLEQFAAAANMMTFYNPQGELTEQVRASARLLGGFRVEVMDQYDADGQLSLAHIVALADGLVATGAVQTFYHGVLAVVSTLTAGDETYYADAVRLADGYEADAETIFALHRLAQLYENIGVADTLQNTLVIVVEETAAIQADDSIELTAHLLAELFDSANVYSLLKTPVDMAQSWVVNTEGEMPISEYDNFEFDSLVQYKGAFYGASDAGLYVMGADTDEGAPITAELASLMLDFGTSRQKRMRSAYLGYTSDNQLVLKVRSVSDGVLSEHWFKACPVSSASAPREGRIFVGQGLRSRYWQFELTNVDGGDFEIDQIEMYPLFLSRRV